MTGRRWASIVMLAAAGLIVALTTDARPLAACLPLVADGYAITHTTSITHRGMPIPVATM